MIETIHVIAGAMEAVKYWVAKHIFHCNSGKFWPIFKIQFSPEGL